jgi:hypothetical protein
MASKGKGRALLLSCVCRDSQLMLHHDLDCSNLRSALRAIISRNLIITSDPLTSAVAIPRSPEFWRDGDTTLGHFFRARSLPLSRPICRRGRSGFSIVSHSSSQLSCTQSLPRPTTKRLNLLVFVQPARPTPVMANGTPRERKADENKSSSDFLSRTVTRAYSRQRLLRAKTT